MPQLSRILRAFFLFAFLSCSLPLFARAGTWVAFQNSYTRGTGAPVTVTSTFSLLNPNTQYTLKAFNGGLQNDTTELVSFSIVSLNGAQVVGPSNFNQGVAEVNVTIFPGLTNTISVQVRGKPGGVLTIQVIGVDNDPPTITASVSPAPNAAGWNNSPVTVTFTCSDKTSGVASCPSPVAVGTEGANQVVSGTATDLAGNTASTSVTINLDMTPPTITGTINPPPDAGGYNSGPVTVTFNCADALSGVASCSSAVSVSGEGSFPETGTAVDVAGNTASTTVTVNIALSYFKVRTWQTNPAGDPSQTGKCLDYGSSPSGNGASVFLNDCANAHPIRVKEINRSIAGAQSYEVMLFAGNLVIGIHNPPIPPASSAPTSTSTVPTTTASSPVTEYPLELQYPFASIIGSRISSSANQIFRLDGDSIILEVATPNPMPSPLADPGPCINMVSSTTLCPPPPPQLVIQVQNGRGSNGSPLVASLRNLADNEFWDFVPSSGSRPYPTTGFMPVATNYDLWNAICADLPQATLTSPPGGQCSSFKAGWGTVVVITGSDPNECNSRPPEVGPCIDLSGDLFVDSSNNLIGYPPILIPAGVTIRGNRRGTLFGPQLYLAATASSNTTMLEVQADYVRVTGLRLRGQSRATSTTEPGTEAVQIHSLQSSGSLTALIAAIDHNDMSDWGDQGVEVDDAYSGPSQSCTGVVNDSATLANATIARNFLHHNERQNDGYGVLAGRAFIEGNTFLMNRHDIAGGSEAHNEYRAWYNLKLSTVPQYSLTDGVYNQDFDVHGTCCTHSGAYGGVGAYGVDIAGNTFLGNNDYQIAGITVSSNWNFELRGYPCYADYFRDNVTVRQQDSNGGNVINFHFVSPGTTSFFLGPDGPLTPLGIAPSPSTLLGNPATLPPGPVFDYNNQFGNSSPPFTDPTVRLGPSSLGVGDFDGDGDDDLFLATGVAWYYSPAGAREWRFLSAKTDLIDTLLLGDFDGDGRTDVVGINPSGQLVVSWGGVSDWEPLNGNALQCSSTADMVAGKFLDHPFGDHRDDIFCANGLTWYISYGGSGPFNFAFPLANSFRVKDLRFGDFNGDGKTDIFSVVNGGWQVSYAQSGFPTALSDWTPLPMALTSSADGLVVGDFSGTGKADVAMSCFSIVSPGCWQISQGGSQPWQQYTIGSWDTNLTAVGHFLGRVDLNGNPIPADLLFWNSTPPLAVVAMCDLSTGVNTELCLSVGGKNQSYRYTSQDMR